MLAAGEHHKVDNDIVMESFEKLMNLYDRLTEKLPTSIFLSAKEAGYLYSAAMEVWRDEALMMKDSGVYKIQKLSNFTKILVALKWAYFPIDVLKLKFNQNL